VTAPGIRVELVARSSSSFFDFFTWGESLWGGPDPWAASDLSLVDITADVRSLRISRGRQRDIDEFRPGTCDVEFNNNGRRYDPTNTDSDIYGNVEPRRGIVVTAIVGGVDYPLFYGYAQQWTVDYAQPNLPLARVSCADALATLATQDLAEIAPAHSGDLSGARVSRILDLPEVNFSTSMRSIDVGLSTFGDTTFGRNAALELQACAQSEGGTLYISNDGILVFEARNTSPGASACTFSDDGDAANVKYQRIDQDMSVDLLYNRIITSGTTGNEQIASDTTSQDAYQIRTLQRTGQLVLSDTEMAEQGQVLLARFATPELRLRQVDVNVAALSAARQAEVLGLELTDRVTVEVHPVGGAPSEISQAAVVNGLDWEISNGATVWRSTVTLQAGERALPWIWGDADQGVWGQNYFSY
jgi:hypothetical protein